MKAYIEAMGCDSNLADANKVIKFLKANNVEIVSDSKKADYIFFMSCGFNNIILNDNLNRLEELKKLDAKIILGGCIPKIKEEIIKKVDFFFSPREISKLDTFFRFKKKSKNFSPSFKRKGKKIIRISTGCDGSCSYCIIRKANGRTKSRSFEEIKRDIEEGLKEGFNKFLFTSEDCGSWGQDINKNIINLVEGVSKIKGNFKVSLTTFNPQWFMKYPKIYECLKKDKIDKKIYLSLQSGSNRILKLMNREYSVEDYLYIFNRLKKEIQDIQIHSDVLVGFPTEKEKDFKKTLDLVTKLDIYFLQVFAYTDMENTPAKNFRPKIDFEISKGRCKKIISTFLEKNKDQNRKLVNTNLNKFSD